ncbi:MAG: hypothetical protein WCR97_03890 [Bacilli bacterium]
MFGNKYKSKSTTKKAKGIIRNEIKSFFGYGMTGSHVSSIKAMHDDAENYAGRKAPYLSDWSKGKELVNGGCFRCYYDDQRKFLNRIYGKKQVSKWSDDKVFNTYGNLIGREYSQMLNKRKK